MLQYEGLYVGAHHAVHLVSLLWACSLQQADQHIQSALNQYAAVAVGMRDDGGQNGQNACLHRDTHAVTSGAWNTNQVLSGPLQRDVLCVLVQQGVEVGAASKDSGAQATYPEAG